MTVAPSSIFTLACRQTPTPRARLPAFALPAVAATPQAPLRPPRPPTRKARIAVYCGWLPRFGVEAQAQQRQLPLQTRTSVRACAAAAASACAAALAHVPFRFLLVRVIVVRNARDPRGNRVYLPLLPPLLALAGSFCDLPLKSAASPRSHLESAFLDGHLVLTNSPPFSIAKSHARFSISV
jgi:hypothetical protein